MTSLTTRVVRIRRVAAAYREHAKVIERLREELWRYQNTTQHRGRWKTDWAQDFLVRHKKWLGPFLDDRDQAIEDYLLAHMELSRSSLREVWKTVKENKVEYEITNHELVNPHWWRGHGLHGTYWQDTATGVGDTPYNALEEALEQLASAGWDVDQITNTLPNDDEHSAWRITEAEVRQEATQQARRDGLSGEDLEDFVEDYVQDFREGTDYAMWYVSVDIRQPEPPLEFRNRHW